MKAFALFYAPNCIQLIFHTKFGEHIFFFRHEYKEHERINTHTYQVDN